MYMPSVTYTVTLERNIQNIVAARVQADSNIAVVARHWHGKGRCYENIFLRTVTPRQVIIQKIRQSEYSF